MAKKRQVECDVLEVDLKARHGFVKGVQVVCSRCGATVSSYGTGDASVLRCFAMLRNGCPLDEDNDYYEAEEE